MRVAPKYRDQFDLNHYEFQYTIAKGVCPRCHTRHLLFFQLGMHYWLYCTRCSLWSWADALDPPTKKGNKYQQTLHSQHAEMVILCQKYYQQVSGALKTKLHLSADPRNIENKILAPMTGLGVYSDLAKELYNNRIYLSTDMPIEQQSKLALFLPIETVPGFLIGWLIITEDGEWKTKANVYSKLIEWVYLKIGGGEPTIEVDSVNEGIVCYLDHLGYDSINIIAKPVLKQLTLGASHLPV